MEGDANAAFTNSLGNSAYISTEDFFQIATNGTARMTFLTNGNVGINHISPSYNLHVAGSCYAYTLYVDQYIYHYNDTNTFISFPSFDTISFNTSGSERLRIDSSGRVGIGTDSPTYPLQIKGGSTSAKGCQLMIENENYNKGIEFRYKSASGSTYDFPQAKIYTSNDTHSNSGATSYDTSLHFSTAVGSTNANTTAVEVMTLDSAGRVGIGTTSPQAGLSVCTVENDGNISNVAGVHISNYQDTNNYKYGYIELVSSHANGAWIDFKTSEGTHDRDGRIRYGNSTVDGFEFYTNSSSGATTSMKMRLNQSGQLMVGYNTNTISYFGTAAVGYCGHGDGASFAHLDCNTSTKYALLQTSLGATIINTASGQDLHFRNNNSDKMILKSSGKVGINQSSPESTLHVNGDIKVTSGISFRTGSYSGTNNNSSIHDINSQDGLQFNGYSGLVFTTTNGVERMRIKGGASNVAGVGNVGIGTNDPQALLHIIKDDNSDVLSEILRLERRCSDLKQGTTNAANAAEGCYIGMWLYDDDATYGTRNEVARISYQLGSDNSEESGRIDFWTKNGSLASQMAILHNGTVQCNSDIIAYYSSDKRLKTKIKQIQNPLEKIQKINGYTFEWIENDKVHINSGNDIGVIAQEVEEVLPEIVTTRDNGYKAVRYEKLTPFLISCIKEQQKQIESQQTQISSLQSQIDELKQLIQNKL